jgi:hypothetical protein
MKKQFCIVNVGIVALSDTLKEAEAQALQACLTTGNKQLICEVLRVAVPKIEVEFEAPTDLPF